MARIGVEQKALTDPRFDVLAGFMRKSRFEALGRMVFVWNECQERGSYTLPMALVSALIGSKRGAQWLIDADLAEKIDENTLRIKGTEGRVEWLTLKREQAKANGKRGGRPKNQPRTNEEPTLVPHRLQPETPPATATVFNTNTNPPTPLSTIELQELSYKPLPFTEVFDRIHQRHPLARPPSQAEPYWKLRAVDPETAARIDIAHLAWCATDEWQRNFSVPTLANWLNAKWFDELPRESHERDGGTVRPAGKRQLGKVRSGTTDYDDLPDLGKSAQANGKISAGG